MSQEFLDSIRNGDLNLVKQFIRSGTDVNRPFLNMNWKKKKLTPLSAALKANQDNVVQFLLENGADIKQLGIYSRRLFQEFLMRKVQFYNLFLNMDETLVLHLVTTWHCGNKEKNRGGGGKE